MVNINHTWSLSIRNMATVTEELNIYLDLTLANVNLNSYLASGYHIGQHRIRLIKKDCQEPFALISPHK